MPILLYTYLSTEILAPFFSSFLILNGILFLGKLMPFLDTIFSFGVGFSDFLRICVYIMPNLLLFSLPMAGMIGVIICFARLSADNEIMAIKACGIGFYRLLPPVVVFALCIAFLTGLCSISLIPKGNVYMKRLLFQLAKEKIDKGLTEHHFSEGIKNLVIYVDRIDSVDNQWHGVYVSDMRYKDTTLNVVARSGNLDAYVDDMRLTLTLLDGTVHRSIGETAQTIEFKRYTLELPMENPKFIGDDRASYVGKGEMSQKELLERADHYGRNTPKGAAMLIEYHKRLVLSAGCLILSLLGLPLALQSRPGGRSLGLPAGLALFVFYYILITAAKSISESGTLPVSIIMWMPNILFGMITIYLIRKAAKETTGGFFDFLKR